MGNHPWHNLDLQSAKESNTETPCKRLRPEQKTWFEICHRLGATVQTFNSCTSRLDVCQCPVIHIPMNNMSKKRSSTSKIHVSGESKLRSVVRSVNCDRIHNQATGWQSGVRSCIMPGLPTHLVQELNVGTVVYTCKNHLHLFEK